MKARQVSELGAPAATLLGIHDRHLQGRTVGAGSEHVGHPVVPLPGLGLTAVKET